MSSENLHHVDGDHFRWQQHHNIDDYVQATYLITTPVAGGQAAFGLAREQSICTTELRDAALPADIGDYCARVVSVEELGGPVQEVAALYFLNTAVYGSRPSDSISRNFRITIAYPVTLFGNSITRLWNSVFGEVHRLGYLGAAYLLDLKLPAALTASYPGPRFGVNGVRDKLGVVDRPLFCRSMRPASGLTTDIMLQVNERVLRGGFDIIKDDELTYDSVRSPFADRVRRMVAMKRRIEDQTGEAKLYFANIIDDFSTSLDLAEQAAELGADGVLLSVTAQGFSFIGEVARRTELIILSHNSCGDVLTRASSWGVSDAVMAQLQRASGADLVVTPGPFATPYQNTAAGEAFLDACRDSLGSCRPVLPIIQGGKQPAHLAQYTEDVGSPDYMIIAAAWLDNHPDGIQAGARAFRDTWDQLQQEGHAT